MAHLHTKLNAPYNDLRVLNVVVCNEFILAAYEKELRV